MDGQFLSVLNKQKKPLNFCEFDNLLKKLLAFFFSQVDFQSLATHVHTCSFSCVYTSNTFVCLRRKFTVWWLNMSKCSIVFPVLVVALTALSRTSYLCIKYKRVPITVRISICCTSAKAHTLFF